MHYHGLEATAENAMSVYQKHLWDTENNALQQVALKKCEALGLEATAKDAVARLTEHDAFIKHWSDIEQLKLNVNNWVDIGDGGEPVFRFDRSDNVGTYSYIQDTLRKVRDTDWRMKKAIEAKLRLDKWSDAGNVKMKEPVAAKVRKDIKEAEKESTVQPRQRMTKEERRKRKTNYGKKTKGK